VVTSYPIALHLEGKACLVVGSNEEAAERARSLSDAGAKLEIVSERPGLGLSALINARSLVHHQRPFELADLDGKWLAVLTDRDLELGRVMAEAAEARHVLFCATDQPQPNSYSHMAQARAGLLTVAISTNGRAPALGRRLREEFARVLLEAHMASFVEALAELRERTPAEQRRDVLGAAVGEVQFEGRLRLPTAPLV
jgi:precorrin-2 dehydrogenase/sirohydrochlorin ferrochelatase